MQLTFYSSDDHDKTGNNEEIDEDLKSVLVSTKSCFNRKMISIVKWTYPGKIGSYGNEIRIINKNFGFTTKI